MHDAVHSIRMKAMGTAISLLMVFSTFGVIAAFVHTAHAASQITNAGGAGATLPLPYVEKEVVTDGSLRFLLQKVFHMFWSKGGSGPIPFVQLCWSSVMYW
jgi:hypothetical protein